MEAGADQARANRVDADALRAEFLRHRARVGHQRALCGRIDRRARTPAVAAGERRHVHHRRSFAEEGLRRLQDEEDRFQVERHDLIKESLVHLAQRLARDHPTRKVDEDVEAATECDTDLVEHRLHGIAVGDVGLDQEGVAARVLDRLQRFLGGFAAAVVIDRDAHTGARERDRDRSADVASAAGDERGFPLEVHVMLFLILGCWWVG